MIKIGKNISRFSTYSCQPKTKDELEKIINDRIAEDGNYCDLNDIDTSLIITCLGCSTILTSEEIFPIGM